MQSITDHWLLFTIVGYLFVGICWVMKNHWSRLAIADRASWRAKKQYWLFVVVPVAVTLLWPLAALLSWKIGQSIKSGEFDRIARQVQRDSQGMAMEFGTARYGVIFNQLPTGEWLVEISKARDEPLPEFLNQILMKRWPTVELARAATVEMVKQNGGSFHPLVKQPS